MNTPFVSIVVPVFNAANYLNDTIKSILDQTYKDFELIIINDGSTDESKAIIQSFSDSRIVYHENNNNKGIVFVRNLGLKLSKGNYIGMVDADDIITPEKFEKQVQFLEHNPDFGLVGSWVKFIDFEGKSLPGKWKLTATPDEIPAIMLFRNYFVQSSVLARKECLHGLEFDSEFPTAQDYLMWAKVISNYKGWNLPEYLVKYRIHTGGITENQKEIREEKEREIFKLQLKKLKITPTVEEMNCHILIKNDMKITSVKQLKEIEEWLLKIIKQNNVTKQFNEKMLIKVVMDRWTKVCYKARVLNVRSLIFYVSSKILFSYLLSKISIQRIAS